MKARFLKIVLIILLLIPAIAASLFMVLESAHFYERFYPKMSLWYMAYWAAALNEIFLAIMAATWLPASEIKSQNQQGHPINYLIKFIMILLFITTVGAASLNVIQEKIHTIQQQKNRLQVLKILENQIQANQEAMETFVSQKQRVNTAIASKKLQKTQDEIKEALKNQPSVFALWIDIILLTLLRFTIQSANLICVWLIGWLYRKPTIKESILTKEMDQENLKNNQLAINQSSCSSTEVEKKSIPIVETNNSKDALLANIQAANIQAHICDKNIELKNHKSVEKKTLKPLPNTKQDKIYGCKPDQEFIIKKNKDSQYKETLNINEKLKLKQEITKLLQQRNSGVSLRDLSVSMNTKESNLQKILDPSDELINFSFDELKKMHHQLEFLYEEQYKTYC